MEIVDLKYFLKFKIFHSFLRYSHKYPSLNMVLAKLDRSEQNPSPIAETARHT